jgi:exostosin family protein
MDRSMRDMMPHIIPEYPKNNVQIFEEWFAENYKGCNTDRVLLPFFPTSFWVNNDYANDLVAKKEAQDYIDSLPNDTKYFGICQYDDGFLIDWESKDVLEFNMSKKIGVELPLLCMPHPYKFISEKKWLVSFVGSRTHPVRNELEKFKDKEGWYISFEPHDIETYCRILHESVFALCPRGYGLNSFRLSEAMQYGSIPIYISDEWIVPFNNDFYYGMRCLPTDDIARSIETVPELQIVKWSSLVEQAYQEYYTYDGCFNNIIKSLETEYHSRKEKTKVA